MTQEQSCKTTGASLDPQKEKPSGGNPMNPRSPLVKPCTPNPRRTRRSLLDRLISIRLSSSQQGFKVAVVTHIVSLVVATFLITHKIPPYLLVDALGDGVDIVELIGLLRRGSSLQSRFTVYLEVHG